MQIESLGAAGGMSGAHFWRITTPCGMLILRRWPQEHPSPSRLRFIHAVLAHAALRDITFIPLPIRATTGESFVEHGSHLWELAPWMPGMADYELASNSEKLAAAMRALARFHVAVADFEHEQRRTSPAINRRLAMLQERQSGGAARLSSSISNTVWPELAPIARTFLAEMPSAIRCAISQLAPLADLPFQLQPCLRDIWHDHVLFIGKEVTGIIDFGAIDIDTPATDVARLLGSLVGDDAARWETGLAAYCSIRPLTSDEIRAVTALDTGGTILAGCNWLRWIYVERRHFENQAQVLERFRKIVVRCIEPRSGFH
jgi:homoserine kinase type II